MNDLEEGHHVNNRPVFRDKVCSDVSSVKDTDVIPVELLSSKSDLLNRILSQVAQVDRTKLDQFLTDELNSATVSNSAQNKVAADLYSKILGLFTDVKIRAGIFEELEDNDVNITVEQWNSLFSEVPNKPAQAKGHEFNLLLAYRQQLNTLIQKLRLMGVVSLKEDYDVERVSHKVSKGMQDSYGTTGEPQSSTITLDMVLLKGSDGQIVNSYWVTGFAGRPTYFVTPDFKNTAMADPLVDFLAVLKKCLNEPNLHQAIDRFINHQF